MKKLLIMLLLMCVVTGLFACRESEETTQPSTGSGANTHEAPGSTSQILIPEPPVTGQSPSLPKGTLPEGTFPSTSQPEYTVPVEPITSQPETEYK